MGMCIRGLLGDPQADHSKKKYEIMRDALVGMYVKELTSEPVHTASHCKTLIKQGNLTRTTATTSLNDQSSRSHMLVTLTVRTTDLHSGDHYVGEAAMSRQRAPSRISQATGPALRPMHAVACSPFQTPADAGGVP